MTASGWMKEMVMWTCCNAGSSIDQMREIFTKVTSVL